MITRRSFLAATAAPLVSAPVQDSVLVHEHVMVDFIGAEKIGPGRYDAEEVFRAAVPKIEEVKRLGCRRIHECTPNYLGRDTRLMARLAEATGVEIWTNTGLYAAANHKFLPEFARLETAEQLARRWIAEARSGVDGVKPRFVKIGVNRAPLHEWDRKVAEAAAITSLETGLTVASHTGDGPAALEQIEIFRRRKAPVNRFVWVHAQSEKNHDLHAQAAKAGAWVEFDGISEKSAVWHRQCVEFMAGSGLLEHTLVSQDSGWYRVGEPQGGLYRGYTYIYTGLLPSLKPEWVTALMRDNPIKAFG